MSISSGLLIETFYPQTKTETDDGMGGIILSWADGTAFKGRLSSLSITERMSQDKQTVFGHYCLFCNVISIDETQRIRNSDSTRYFGILSVTKPSNLATGHLEIIVKEVD